MEGAFFNASILQVNAIDSPDLTTVESLSAMFIFCASLTGNTSFNNWDTSNVKAMSALFSLTKFNQDISS